MKIYKGQIKDTTDLAKEGLIYVDAGQNLGLVDVFYTSPFGGEFSPKGKAGFFAIPEVDSEILFVRVDGSYYYLSTIHKRSLESTIETGKNVIKDRVEQGHFPPGLYSQATPSRLVLMDRKGNTMRFNHAYDESNGFSTGIDLISRDRKKLLLNDSPNCYGIYLQNEEGDGITIASEYKDGYTAGPKIAPREIAINTAGKVSITSRKSSIRMLVKDGQDINIRNESVGMANLYPTAVPASPISVTEPYGNVRVSSDVRDVYITAGDGHKFMQLTLGQAAWSPLVHRSRVMVKAFGEEGLIQISSDGKIIIRAPNDSIYIHGGSVNVKSESDLNLHAKTSVNIAAGTTIKLSSNILALLEEGDSEIRPPFVDELTEQAYDSRFYTRTFADIPIPTPYGHIELGVGVLVNGERIDLAPVAPPIRARKAVHPYFELSDYDGSVELP